MFTRNGRLLFVTVKMTSSGSVLQSDQISVVQQLDGIGAVPFGSSLVEFLDEPAIVAVFVAVSGDLLLLGAHSFRIQMQMRVQISSAGDAVFQRQQRAVCHF